MKATTLASTVETHSPASVKPTRSQLVAESSTWNNNSNIAADGGPSARVEFTTRRRKPPKTDSHHNEPSSTCPVSWSTVATLSNKKKRNTGINSETGAKFTSACLVVHSWLADLSVSSAEVRTVVDVHVLLPAWTVSDPLIRLVLFRQLKVWPHFQTLHMCWILPAAHSIESQIPGDTSTVNRWISRSNARGLGNDQGVRRLRHGSHPSTHSGAVFACRAQEGRTPRDNVDQRAGTSMLQMGVIVNGGQSEKAGCCSSRRFHWLFLQWHNSPPL